MPIPSPQIIPGFEIPIVEFAKSQPEYLTLPAWRGHDGLVVTRWKFSFMERLKILFTGDLWLSIKTFNSPLQPVKLTTVCPIMGHTGYDKEV